MRLLKLLHESPDEAEFGGWDLSFQDSDALTFGISDGRFYSALASEAPQELDLLIAPGVMTHGKLSLMAAGIAEEVGKALPLRSRLLRKYGLWCLKKQSQEHLISKMLSYAQEEGETDERAIHTAIDEDLHDIALVQQILELAPEGYTQRTGIVFDSEGRGRAWYHPTIGLLISFWDNLPTDDIMQTVIADCKAKLEPDAERVWVQDINMSDNEWLPHGNAPIEIKVNVQDRIKALSTMLHTATPEDKQKIKFQIKKLRDSGGVGGSLGIPEEGSTKAGLTAHKAGFQTAAEYNNRRKVGESILSQVRRGLR